MTPISDDTEIYKDELIDFSVESFLNGKPKNTSDSDQLSRCKAGANQSGSCLPQNECQRSAAERNQFMVNKSCDENKAKNSKDCKAKKNRSRERKDGESRVCDGSQSSSKRISKPPRSNTNMFEGQFEDSNNRLRRLENVSSNRPQSRKNQPPTSFIPNDSYDYDDYQPDYYTEAEESPNRRQNGCNPQQPQQNCNTQQQQHQQNYNTQRQQQFCGQTKVEYQTNVCNMPISDAVREATPSTSDIQKAEENLARIEMQRLSLLQCIEQHQRALVEKTQQLLKNEQEQIKLRSEYEKRKMTEFQKQMNAQIQMRSQSSKSCLQANGLKKSDKKCVQPKTSCQQAANCQPKRKKLIYQPPSPSTSTECSIEIDEVNGKQQQKQQQCTQIQGKPKKRIPYVPPSETDDSCFSEIFGDSQTIDTSTSTNRTGYENQCNCQPDISKLADRMPQCDNRKPKNSNGYKNKRNAKKAEKTRRRNFTNEYYYLTPQEGIDNSQAQSSNCGDCNMSSRSLLEESKNSSSKRCSNQRP